MYKFVAKEERKEKTEINGELITYLKFMNDFFKENFKSLSARKKTLNYIIENEDLFNKIEEVCNNA